MAYSAVTHPFPLPRRNAGTPSSTEAAQITLVWPTSIKAEPSAVGRNFGVMEAGRGSLACRPSVRIVRDVPFRSRAPAAREGSFYPRRIGAESASETSSLRLQLVRRTLRLQYLHDPSD